MATWGSGGFTEEDQTNYARLERYPASKMSSTDLARFSELCYKKTLVSKREFGKWLSESAEVQQCLSLKEDQFEQAQSLIEGLARFDPDDRLGVHPSQESLRTTMAKKHDKLVGLIPLLIRFEAIHTKLNNVLTVAGEIWQGMSTRQSEWQVRGELITFPEIKRLRRLRALASEVLAAAKKLQEVLIQGHQMESRLVEVRRQELQLGE